MLLISMHAIKKVAQKYGLDLYGTEYTAEELFDKMIADETYTAIVFYNTKHFLNVIGLIRDAQGNITHIRVSDGYIGGVEQLRNIEVDEFTRNYEGKILATEKSDYDKRLTDKQLMNIKGAGWWSKLWKGIVKIFKKIVKAIKKIINYIIEPIKAFIEAIGYASKAR